MDRRATGFEDAVGDVADVVFLDDLLGFGGDVAAGGEVRHERAHFDAVRVGPVLEGVVRGQLHHVTVGLLEHDLEILSDLFKNVGLVRLDVVHERAFVVRGDFGHPFGDVVDRRLRPFGVERLREWEQVDAFAGVDEMRVGVVVFERLNRAVRPRLEPRTDVEERVCLDDLLGDLCAWLPPVVVESRRHEVLDLEWHPVDDIPCEVVETEEGRDGEHGAVPVRPFVAAVTASGTFSIAVTAVATAHARTSSETGGEEPYTASEGFSARETVLRFRLRRVVHRRLSGDRSKGIEIFMKYSLDLSNSVTVVSRVEISLLVLSNYQCPQLRSRGFPRSCSRRGLD